ncbi:hypothetical protein IP87_18170 [beta proteobacterium AAP121]|nr:hypothetical protein IP80_06880 [beta proteobacterium AAP65]KPF94801.1 hypothetical protein IP87_18170 [beta proteobacterium AAP121]
MARLRQQVQQAYPADLWWHCDDHQVLTGAALLARWNAASGTEVGLQMKPLALTRLAPAPAATPPAPSPAAAARRAAPAAAPAPGTFEIELDVAAMVAVLQQAARDGVPFCEECARAAQEA